MRNLAKVLIHLTKKSSVVKKKKGVTVLIELFELRSFGDTSKPAMQIKEGTALTDVHKNTCIYSFPMTHDASHLLTEIK